MGLSGQIGVHAQLSHTAATVLGATPALPLNYAKNWDITSGVGANQADEAYVGERTLADGASENIDLTGTFFQNVFGVNIAFVKVKAIIIESLDANTTNLTIGNGTTPFPGPFGAGTYTVVLSPGDVFACWKKAAAGWAVGAGASDILKVANAAGAAATYRLILIGTKS